MKLFHENFRQEPKREIGETKVQAPNFFQARTFLGGI